MKNLLEKGFNFHSVYIINWVYHSYYLLNMNETQVLSTNSQNSQILTDTCVCVCVCVYKIQLKSSWFDQDTLMEYDQMRFIFY